MHYKYYECLGFVEFKIYISLKPSAVFNPVLFVCRIQNLHISQTVPLPTYINIMFVEFKIYISLKQDTVVTKDELGL